MDRALRHALVDGLGVAFLLALAVVPATVLLWSWRRWGSWRRLAVHAALLVPAMFALTGAVVAVPALARVARHPTPPGGYGPGLGPAEYVARTYWRAGSYGLGVAGLFALAWVPWVLAWRRAHPNSFRRVVRAGPTGRGSFAEQDYGDAITAELVVAPDPRRN